MMKAAVGKGSAEPLVKEEEEQSDIDSFCREVIGVPFAIALE